MKDRIKLVRKEVLNMTQQEFADMIGVSKVSVGYYETDKRTPASSILKLISEKSGVSYDWLLTGTGEMKAPKDELDEIADITAALFKDADPMRRQLAKLVFALDTEEIKAVKSIWDKMLNIDTKKEH